MGWPFEDYKALFERLAEAYLTVNMAKSEFCHATVEYLDHKVGPGFVRPISAKVESINNFPSPTNKMKLMWFLRMVGFYRKFCPNYKRSLAL